jgi:protein O-GlcNAc transferase
MSSRPIRSQRAPDLAQAIQQAVDLHRQGRLTQAEDLYRAILARRPQHFDALHYLGLIKMQQGSPMEALGLIAAAVKTKPYATQALSTLGAVLTMLDRHHEALANYDRILRITPNDAEALYNRGVVFSKLGRDLEALASFDKALSIAPASIPALFNRGNVLVNLGRYRDALASFDRTLAHMPHHIDALNNRGNVLAKLGRYEEALASYDRVLAMRGDHINALENRSHVLGLLGRYAEALASCDKALAYKPDHAEAHNSRGDALRLLGRLQEAHDCYRKALRLKPDFAEAHNNLGVTLAEQGKIDEAVACHERALDLKPDFAEAWFALCMAQLPILYMDEAEIGRRRAAYQNRLGALCADFDGARASRDLASAVGWRQPFFLAYQGYNDKDLQSLYGSLVCRVMAERYPAAPLPPPPGVGEPVRVGIVSRFFREHSNWKIPISGWLTQLDRSQFRLFGYHTGVEEDHVTKTAARLCDRFVQGPLSNDGWRQAILADAPHVLIYPEIGMDPIAARLAAQRLAVTQCNSWGHPETSGYPTLDYYLSSELMEPSDGESHYTERLVRLPNLSIYYEPPAIETAPLDRPDLGLRSTATIYWCGQSLFKYLPQFDEVFPRIARQVENCQFAFIEDAKSAHVTELFRKRLDAAFAAFGLRAADYCNILPRLGAQGFAAAIGQCDIVLDSIGWSGCNSTLESLAHDLPIVTMPGPLMRGRHTTAILKMMGITATIAATVDDYVSTAIRLARDEQWRKGIKIDIARNKHRLYRDRDCILALQEFLKRVARHGPADMRSTSDARERGADPFA